MDQLPVSKSAVTMCQSIYSEDCRVNKVTKESHVRLGVLLKYMDICACLSIEKLAKASCVTASMDHLIFTSNRCIHDGEAVLVEAKVVRCFNKSAEVIVRVNVDSSMSLENTSAEETFCLAHAFFIFVRLDKGKMPVVFPQTSVERQEYELAMERRKTRMYMPVKNEVDGPSVPFSLQTKEQGNAYAGASVPAECSLLEYTHIVLPTHANHMGNTFGGQILHWAEEIAVLSATMHLNGAIKDKSNFYYCDKVKAESNQSPRGSVSALTRISERPNPVLSTVYVHAMSFLKPSTVGDRILCRAQCCRSFGSIVEVEVVITAMDVAQTSVRHINTGHFCICCTSASNNADIFMPPVIASTTEQIDRYNNSLKRMVVASVRSASKVNALDSPQRLKEYSQQGTFMQLSTMLKVQESSIWNSEVDATLSLSPQFEAECATEFALQDTCGLLCALGPTDSTAEQSAHVSWDKVPLDIEGVFLFVKPAPKGISQVKLQVTIDVHLANVSSLLLDLTRRGEWDAILKGRVVKSVMSHVDIVWMGSSAPGKGIDYALLRCYREMEDGRVAIVSRSIIHADLPANAESTASTVYTRGEVLPSGYLLTATGENNQSTILQYLLQMDTTSAQQFSGEMHGKSNLILSSMIKLKKLLETEKLQGKLSVKPPDSNSSSFRNIFGGVFSRKAVKK